MISLLQDLLLAYTIVLFIRIAFSWIRITDTRGVIGQIDRWAFRLTEPLLAPIRRLLPAARVGAVAIDFSTVILLFIIWIIRSRL